MNLNVQGRKALVCGATDGIGRSVAIALAESGATIVAFARSEEKLLEFVQILPGTGHHMLVADFDDPGVVQSVLNDHLAAHGTPDIVVNNSGGPPGGALSDASSQSFITAMNRLLLSSHEIVKLCLPGMKAQGFGRIINVISTSVRQPLDNLGVSNTIRSATSAWAKTLSREVAEYGVTVTE